MNITGLAQSTTGNLYLKVTTNEGFPMNIRFYATISEIQAAGKDKWKDHVSFENKGKGYYAQWRKQGVETIDVFADDYEAPAEQAAIDDVVTEK